MFMRLFLLLFLVSCSTVKVEKDLRQIPSYMTKGEVLQEMEKGPQRLEMNDPKLTEREANLIPLNELFKDSPKVEKKSVREEQAIDITSLPVDVDLRQFATPVKEQWNGTCSTFGLIATQELAHCKFRGECNLDLSERHFWDYYERYSSPTALKNASKYVALEKYWPQKQSWRPSNISKYAKYNITSSEYLGGDSELAKKKVLKALADGYPIYFWSQTPSCMLSGKKTCGPKDNKFSDGGHAYSVVGYFNKDNPILIIKNSWGTDNGDNGYQYLSFKIYDNSSYWEAAAIKGVGIKDDIPTPPKTQTKCEWRWSISHFWKKVQYCWEEEI